MGETFMSRLPVNVSSKNPESDNRRGKSKLVERRTLILTVVLIAIVTGSAIGVYTFMTVTPKDVYVHDTIGDPRRFDPARAYDTASGTIIDNVYERLLDYDGESTSEVKPVLAESWSISADGLTFTFVLRQGIRFQDGTPFNASCVKWSFDRIILINAPSSPAWMMAWNIKGGYTYYTISRATSNNTKIFEAAKNYLDANGVEVVSNYVVKIHLDYQNTGKAHQAFRYILTQSWASIISPSFVESLAGGAAADAGTTNVTMSFAKYLHDNYGTPIDLSHGMGIRPKTIPTYMVDHACGTGPYKVVEWTRTQRVVLERNDDYWGAAPAIRRVIINTIPEFGTRKLRLLSGEADSTVWGASYADQLIDVNSRTVLPQYAGSVTVILDKPTMAVDAFELTMNATLQDCVATKNHDPALGVHENPLQYKEFRQAINYCFDRDVYIAALNGFGQKVNGPCLKGFQGYDPNVPKGYSLDLDKASQLFAAVGWEGTIQLYYNTGNDERKKSCLMLKDNIEFASGGKIKGTVNEVDWPTYLDMAETGTMPIWLIGWLSDYPDTDNNVVAYCHTTGDFASMLGYSNATIDNMIKEAAVEPDPTVRSTIYQQISTEINEEAVYIWVSQPLSFRVQRSWVQGYFYNMAFSGPHFWYYWKA